MFFTSNELKSTFVCDLGDCSSSRPCMGVQKMFGFQCSVKRYHTFFVSDSFLPDTVSEKEKETRIMIITLKDGSKKNTQKQNPLSTSRLISAKALQELHVQERLTEKLLTLDM